MNSPDLQSALRTVDHDRHLTPAIREASLAVLDQIAATPAPRVRRRGLGRSREVGVLWATAAAAVVLFVLIATSIDPGEWPDLPVALGGSAMDGAGIDGAADDDGPSPTIATDSSAYTDSGPHLLLDAPGWVATRLDVIDDRTGEMTFEGPSNGTIDLLWRPAEQHDRWLGQVREGTLDLPPVEVTGIPAEVNGYSATDLTAIWTDGTYSLTLRGFGGFEDASAFAELASSLRSATPQQWSDAIPESTVPAPDRDRTAAEMLDGMPLPPGHDLDEALAGDAQSRDRYQLGARVVASVACGWIEEWIDANARTDQGRIDAAVVALATAREWPILIEMQSSGAYPDVVYEYAEAIAGDGTVLGGRVLSVEESYADALGC